MAGQGAPTVGSTASNDEGIYDNWDPTGQDYHSVQNLVGVDQENPVAYQLGIKERRVQWKDVPCPFYKGVGDYCWKGQTCPRKHEKVNLSANDLGKEAIITVVELDQKPVLYAGDTVQVHVQHKISPNEFYVIPETTPRCFGGEDRLYQRPDSPDLSQSFEACNDMNTYVDGEAALVVLDAIRKKEKIKDFGEGMEAFENIKQKLGKILNHNTFWRLKQYAFYSETQLVAVKFSNTEGIYWLRGEVLEVDVKQAVGREIPWHTVRLIDTGEVVTICADKLCTLPKQLSYHPPLVYKCQLDEIVPVRYRWNKSALELFMNLTSRKLTMTVKDAKHLVISGTVETTPYVVDLLIPVADVGPDSAKECWPRSVTQELVKAGAALQKSLLPYHCSLEGAVEPWLIPVRHEISSTTIKFKRLEELSKIEDGNDPPTPPEVYYSPDQGDSDDSDMI